MIDRLRSIICVTPVLLVIGYLLFVPPEAPPPREPAPVGVSPEFLWRTPDAWKDQRVRVLLIATGYKTAHGCLLWYDGNPTHPPAVVFECPAASVPVDNTDSLELVGTCRGRMNGRVLVEGCAVRVVNRRLP